MTDNIRRSLSFLNHELVSEIMENSTIQEFAEGTTMVKEGEYIKVIPFVLTGLIKVFTSYEDKELLLYYIKPNDSCIMSFSAGIANQPSKVYAITEKKTTALLMPSKKISTWISQYPDINNLFYHQYKLRYSELLNTINHILFDKLDVRIFEYLQKKTDLTKQNLMKISHRQIASELVTAREVVSRTLKKLETEGKVRQRSGYIELI
ncbi:MAG: Crp/Fnr family transcriptional regulator [Bacteroidota bacterium]